MKKIDRQDLRNYMEYLVEEVENVGSKPWLIPALTSHVHRRFKEFHTESEIREEVQLWFSETKEIPNEEEK